MSDRAILFDLDGTLIDSAQGIAAALNELRAERGLSPLAVAAVRPLVALGVDALVTKGLSAETCEALDIARFRDLLGGLIADPGMIYPGVGAMLDDLIAAGCDLAIVTNKPERLSKRLLDELGLLGQFRAVVGGDTAIRAKPDAAPILYALSALGHSAQSAIFVGDSAVDAVAASACKVPFILFRGGYGAASCRQYEVAAHFDRHDQLLSMIGSPR